MAQAQPTKSAPKAEIDLDAQPPAGSKTKKIVIFAGIGVLVIALGVTAFLLLRKPAEGAKEAEPAKVEAKAALYVPFKPFVVNFAEKGPARFLQVEIQVVASSPAVNEALNIHTPAIRNDVNMLLAGQTFEQVSTREGKEALREEIKKAIQNILDQQKVAGTVDAVYFTSFVMQ